MHEKEEWINAIRDNSSETIASIILADIERIEKQEQEIERLNNIINELREMLEHKVEFHKNLDFYEDKELETQAYYNYVACLQDFDEIVEKYKLGK